MGSITLLAYVPINIDPVIFYIGPSALRWHGLMYVVGIVFGLWVIRGYTALIGITQDMVYRILWWCVVAGLTRSAHGSTQSGKPAGTRILVTDSRTRPPSLPAPDE